MMTETALTIADFIAARGISMTADKAHGNPSTEADDWSKKASHWSCTLIRDGKSMSTTFSMGEALKGPPSTADVLDSLASDAATVANASDFEDWAAQLGYDTDSRKAEHTYEACSDLADALREFLGDEDFDILLYHCERL